METDDAFERLLHREEEIRSRLEAGEIDEAEATALRDLAGEQTPRRDGQLHFTVEQVARMVDEGVEPEVIRRLMSFGGDLSLDRAIDLAVNYGIDEETVDQYMGSGVGFTVEQVARMVDEGVEPGAIRRLMSFGLDLSLEEAIDLAVDYGIDEDTVQEYMGSGIGPLPRRDLVKLWDNDVCQDALAEAVSSGAADPIARAIAITHGYDEDDDEDEEGGGSGLLLSMLATNDRGKQFLLGAGDRTLIRSGTVTGLFIGDLTVAPEATVVLEATVIGDLHIEEGATVELRGRVIGDIENNGTLIRPGDRITA